MFIVCICMSFNITEHFGHPLISLQSRCSIIFERFTDPYVKLLRQNVCIASDAFLSCKKLLDDPLPLPIVRFSKTICCSGNFMKEMWSMQSVILTSWPHEVVIASA